MAAKTKKEFWATGRRKTAVARVCMAPGKGDIVINSQPLPNYFGRETLRLEVVQPFEATGMAGKFDIRANLTGGGSAAQAVALRHGIARALIGMDPNLRKPLKTSGLLTRDPREKERRKVGRRKARKRPQYSKR